MSEAVALPVAGELVSDRHPAFFAFGSMVFTVQGMAPPESAPPLEMWAQAGTVLATTERGAPFMVGDWILYGESAYGERAAQAIDAHAWSASTVRVYRNLAKNVPPDVRRMDKLGIRHHLAVQTLAPDAQREWLNKAADDPNGPWTVRQFTEAIQANATTMVESMWGLLVECPNRAVLETLAKELELRGLICHERVTKKPQ